MCPKDLANVQWDLTVKENLEFVAGIKGLSDDERTANLDLIIDTFGLDQFSQVYARNLSGGNKRKLGCATSLLVCPTIEFMDDPTIGMDPIAQQRLIKTLDRLHGSAVLIATEQMDIAENLCDYVAIMGSDYNCRFIAYGTPQQIKQVRRRVRAQD